MALLNPKKRNKILVPTEDDDLVEGFFIKNQKNLDPEEIFVEPDIAEIMDDDDEIEFVDNMDVEE